MLLKRSTQKLALASVLAALSITGCKYFPYPDDDHGGPDNKPQFKNYSVTPALVKKLSGFEGLKIYSLIGSDDVLPESPGFVYGGSADGAGFLRNGSGYTMLVNHEDNFSVSRITLDKNLKPVKGEYLLNSDGGQWRLCSATLATPQEHGFGPYFITCGESGEESRIHAISPLDGAGAASISREVPALGRWSTENAVPLPKQAFNGKTVIIIGDDDSGVNGGQVALYVANQGDLQGGNLYMLRRRDRNQRERDMVVGQSYEVEFVKIQNHTSLTGAQINAKVDELKAIKFGRVEDLDYRKGSRESGREIYFNVTGQDNTRANADYSRSKYGRVYKLVLNAEDPTKGRLQVVLDGDDRQGKAGSFQNVDNICVTTNYAYLQEDPNGYGDETHDSYIYQYDLNTGALRKVLELDHRRNAPDQGKYNVGGPSDLGDWEYGALVDISDVVGVPNTFTLNIQPHTWVGDKYKGVDGGKLRAQENQASQTILLVGLPR